MNFISRKITEIATTESQNELFLKFLENTFTILAEVEKGVRTFLHRSPDATNRASVQFLAKSPKPLDPTCHEKNVERENVDASKRRTSFRHVGV